MVDYRRKISDILTFHSGERTFKHSKSHRLLFWWYNVELLKMKIHKFRLVPSIHEKLRSTIPRTLRQTATFQELLRPSVIILSF